MKAMALLRTDKYVHVPGCIRDCEPRKITNDELLYTLFLT